MPAPYGVTDDGFSAPTFEELFAAYEQRLRDKYGISIDTSDAAVETVVGKIFLERLIEAWEALEVVYGAVDPDAALGALLENLCLLTGTFKRASSSSTVTLTLTGDNTTVISAGSKSKVLSTESVFEHTEGGTLALLTAWVATTGYVVGDRRSNGGNAYVCITAGTSAGSGGPTTESADITDGTVHWRFMGEGLAAADVEAAAVITGPIVAVSGDITEIDTPVAGWKGVINLLDADVGHDEDSNQDLRLRRDADLARAGSSPIDALRAELLDPDNVPGVISVSLNVNNSDDPLVLDDGVILPPHSVEALVRGGDDQDIINTLFAGVAGGITTFGFAGGLVSGTAIDSEGVSHVVRFARPEEVLIYVDVVLTYDVEEYPDNGDAQAELAIVTWGDAQKTGRNADSSAISARVFDVDGVLTAAVTVDDAPAPVGSTVAIGRHQLAVYDTSRINVTSTVGTP